LPLEPDSEDFPYGQQGPILDPPALQRIRELLLSRLMPNAFANPAGPQLRMMGMPANMDDSLFGASRGPSLRLSPELYSSGQGGLPELRGKRYP